MTPEELRVLISLGEGSTLEFKESLNDDLGKQLCGFANSAGGKIILGIKDNATITGITVTNRLIAQIHDYARNIDPSLNVAVERVGNVLVVSVPEGTRKPYAANGRFYLRQGATTQQLRRDEIRDLFHQERLILFDDQANGRFDLRKDFSEGALQHFITRSKITRIQTKELLENLGLVDNGKLRNAGVLLFCKDVKRFFLSATLTCVLYQGTT